jgi:hypothetical protein
MWKRDSLVTNEEKLLFDIFQELKEINQKLTVRPVAKGAECKYCGGTHENKGQVLACAKKKRKEGA